MRDLFLYTLAVAYLAICILFVTAVVAIGCIWVRYWFKKYFRKSLKRKQMELVDKWMGEGK